MEGLSQARNTLIAAADVKSRHSEYGYMGY